MPGKNKDVYKVVLAWGKSFCNNYIFCLVEILVYIIIKKGFEIYLNTGSVM